MDRTYTQRLKYNTVLELFESVIKFESIFSDYKKNCRPSFKYNVIPNHKELTLLIHIEDKVEYDYTETN